MTTARTRKIPARAWGIVVLVSLALLLFILDRQVLSVLKTTLKVRMGWTDQDYSWLMTGFSVAYTLGALAAGRFIDRAGTRLTATLFNGRKVCGVFTPGPGGEEVPAVWVDRMGAKVGITEQYSRASKGTLSLVAQQITTLVCRAK